MPEHGTLVHAVPTWPEMGDGLLIDPPELAARLGEPGWVLDATVHLRREHPRGPYEVQSAREDYERQPHTGQRVRRRRRRALGPRVAQPAGGSRRQRFAHAAGALGISRASHVVTYSQHSPMWATRLWWLLRISAWTG